MTTARYVHTSLYLGNGGCDELPPHTHTHTACSSYSCSTPQYSPSDLLARGEVEEDWAFHDVELALSCAAYTGEGIIRALKLNKSLAEAWHHGDVARWEWEEVGIAVYS